MPDLIIHIGFPKCASTTLQNQVFKNTEGYLGTYKGLPKAENLAKQFKAVTPVGPRQWSNLSQAKLWAVHTQRKYPKDLERLILSDEMLTNKNKFSLFPIIAFLEKFSKEIWDSGDVKVIIVLRNNAEVMASGYAQGSAGNPDASQLDFERKMKYELSNGYDRDYSEWVSKLYTTLGKECVCVLLMEEIGTDKFWYKLKSFCDLPEFEPATMLESNKNSKRISNNSWNILPFSAEAKANQVVNNLFGFAWPYFVFKNRRENAMRASKAKLSQFYKNKYPNANDNREVSFELSDNLRKNIQSHFSESTKKLSKLLGKDMAALGY